MSAGLPTIKIDAGYAEVLCNLVDRLQQRLEQAQARVAQLESRICRTCDGRGLIGGPSFSQPDEGGEDCPECSAFVLRKQAEAIVQAAEANGLAGGRSHYALCSDLICDAKEMFEQADELEKAGGDRSWR